MSDFLAYAPAFSCLAAVIAVIAAVIYYVKVTRLTLIGRVEWVPPDSKYVVYFGGKTHRIETRNHGVVCVTATNTSTSRMTMLEKISISVNGKDLIGAEEYETLSPGESKKFPGYMENTTKWKNFVLENLGDVPPEKFIIKGKVVTAHKTVTLKLSRTMKKQIKEVVLAQYR